MEKLKFNPDNKKYYSEEFIKGFECGVERQFEKDKAEIQPIVLGKWIYKDFNWYCSNCNQRVSTPGYVGTAEFMKEHFKICNHCGAKMEGGKPG